MADAHAGQAKANRTERAGFICAILKVARRNADGPPSLIFIHINESVPFSHGRASNVVTYYYLFGMAGILVLPLVIPAGGFAVIPFVDGIIAAAEFVVPACSDEFLLQPAPTNMANPKAPASTHLHSFIMLLSFAGSVCMTGTVAIALAGGVPDETVPWITGGKPVTWPRAGGIACLLQEISPRSCILPDSSPSAV